MIIRCDPVSGRQSQPPHSIPFSTSQADRLYVVHCDSVIANTIQSLVLFVPLSTFMAQIDTVRVGESTLFTWAEWGGKGTRMLHLRPSSTWITFVHGMKFAIVWKQQIKIFDFNQLAFKRDQLHGQLKNQPRSILYNWLFSEPITSSLDCRVHTTLIPDIGVDPSMFQSVLLTEDNLIAIPVCPYVCRLEFVLMIP